MSFSTCTVRALALITHARHAALVWIQNSGLPGLGGDAMVLVCSWRRTPTGWSSHILTLFPSSKLTPMATLAMALRAILARLPGRQYQRDASKQRCSCPPIPFRSMDGAFHQWTWRQAGRDSLTCFTLARCVY